MTKDEALKLFYENFSKLKVSDYDVFSKLVLKFLKETFLIREKDSDKKDYLKAIDLLDVLRPYFIFMDYDLVINRTLGVIYIRTNQDSNRIRFKKLETVIALILRYIYDDESSKSSLNSSICTTVKCLFSEINKTEIYPMIDGRSMEFKEALKNLKKWKLIDFNGDISLGSTPIVIFKSIILIVDTNSINELKNRLNNFKGGNDDANSQETETD